MKVYEEDWFEANSGTIVGTVNGDIDIVVEVNMAVEGRDDRTALIVQAPAMARLLLDLYLENVDSGDWSREYTETVGQVLRDAGVIKRQGEEK